MTDIHVPYRHPPVAYRQYLLTICPAGPWWWLHLTEGTTQAAPPRRIGHAEHTDAGQLRMRCDMALATMSLQPVGDWYRSGLVAWSIRLQRLDVGSAVHDG